MYSITSIKLCAVALFKKNEGIIRNYCQTVVELNLPLSQASQVVNRLWFVEIHEVKTFAVVCPQKDRETLIMKSPVSMIKIDLSCTLSSDCIITILSHQKLIQHSGSS